MAEALRKRGACVLLVGAEGGLEASLARKAGIEFAAVPVVRPGRGVFCFLRFGVRMGVSFMRAFRLIRSYGPDVVVGMGSYASFAVVQTAALLGVPTVIHEQNAVPGRANRILGRRASAVALTFEEAASWFPAGRTHVTGLPVRDGMGSADRSEAFEFFGLEPNKRTLLVLGGSQGALSLNTAVQQAAQTWLENGIQILHITGASHFEQARKHARRGYAVQPYVERMDLAYSACDLALCRAGAGTMAELAVCGVPSILVPYPYAADNHQEANARVFSAAGASVVISDRELRSGAAVALVLELMRYEERLRAMSLCARKLARPRAAEDICDIIGNLAVDCRIRPRK